MELKGSKLAVPPERTPDSQQVGGALFRGASEDRFNIPARYEIVPISQMEALLRSNGVLGTDNDLIQRQLEQRHPSPTPLASYLYYYDGEVPIDAQTLERQRARNPHRRYHRRYGSGEESTVEFEGWLLFEQLYTENVSPDTIMQLTQEYGALLIPQDHVARLGDTERLRSLGFVVVNRRWDLAQINFNPQRTKLDGYRKAVKEYTRRQQKIDDHVIAAFYYCLSPQRHRRSRVFDNVQVHENERAGPADVKELAELTRKLWPKDYGWWREDLASYYYCPTRSSRASLTFVEAIKQCLPLLHAEEAKLVKEWTKEDGEVMKGGLKDDARRWLCKFIRAEAKALGFKIPPKPRPPKKTKKRRKHAQNSRRTAGSNAKLPGHEAAGAGGR